MALSASSGPAGGYLIPPRYGTAKTPMRPTPGSNA